VAPCGGGRARRGGARPGRAGWAWDRRPRFDGATLRGEGPESDLGQEVIGARSLVRREDPYRVLAPICAESGMWCGNGRSTHPPTAFLLALPLAAFPWRVAYAVWGFAMLATLAVASRALGAPWPLAAAIAPLSLVWPPVAWSLGQVTPIWLLGIALGWRYRRRAAAAGVAALTKLLPALVAFRSSCAAAGAFSRASHSSPPSRSRCWRRSTHRRSAAISRRAAARDATRSVDPTMRRSCPRPGCASIAGATGLSYVVAAVDVGTTLRVRVTATNAGGSSVAASAPTAGVTNPAGSFYDSTVVDPGCGGCLVGVDAAGTLSARIQGGADGVDTAYGLRDFGGTTGLTGRVYVRTLLGLAAGQTLSQNLAVLQVRDASNALVYELYLTPSRMLTLWSPVAALRSVSINQSTGVVAPNNGTSTIRVEVSALANSSLTVRVNDVDRFTIDNLTGATTGNQRYLRAGIDHYDEHQHRPWACQAHAATGGGVEIMPWLRSFTAVARAFSFATARRRR
jgi:hypothetical protein